jgi:hypothetical protein
MLQSKSVGTARREKVVPAEAADGSVQNIVRQLG